MGGSRMGGKPFLVKSIAVFGDCSCVYVHAFLFQLNMTEFRYYTLNKGNALCLQLFATCVAGFWCIFFLKVRL